MACNKLDSVEAGFLLLTADKMPGQRRGEAVMAGLAQDGVTSVSVQIYKSGPIYRVPVKSNVWTLTANGSAQQTPVKLVFHTATGERQVRRR